MKALILHGPGNYRVHQDWPEPAVKPGWARVHVTHAGICGSDLPRFGSTGSYRHPMILGHEFCGVVDTPAPDSQDFRGGETVAILPILPCGRCDGCRLFGPFHCRQYGFLGSRDDGGFAEYCLVPESNLFRLPEGLDPRFGAFIEPLAVGLHVIRRSGFSGTGTALVYGAGAIGLIIAMWLRGLGASRVVVADIRAQNLQIARQVGFQDVINPLHDTDRPSESYDLTFEAAGATNALVDAITRTRARGTLTIVGRNTSDTVIPLREFERLMRKELTVQTCWGYDLRGEEDLLYSALEQGWFPLAPLITHQVGIDAAPAMIRQMLDHRIFYCKVLLAMEALS